MDSTYKTLNKDEVQEMKSVLEDNALGESVFPEELETTFHTISEEVKSALEEGDLSEVAERFLKEVENAPLNIAITGEWGTGKSTLVNALRGMDDEEEGSAKTGVVETTKKPMPYPHPQYPNVTIWDLPGIGTPEFAADHYLESVEFSQYDFFIIISSGRFKHNDIDLAKAIQARDKKFYFVRSKVDSDLLASKVRRKKLYNEENILNEIRQDCTKNLKNWGISEPRVFLLLCLELEKYDFNAMLHTLEKDLPKQKRHAFLISLPNMSLLILEKKRQTLMNEIWRWAALSCAVAAVPIPGLSVGCDVRILENVMIDYQKAFGLDKKSLQQLADKTGIDVRELRSVIKSPLVLGEINKKLIISLKNIVVRGVLKIVKYALSRVCSITLLGTIAAGGISFGITYLLLYVFLKEIAEDAVRVLKKALESSTVYKRL